MNKIIITGGNGFIGSRLVNTLLSQKSVSLALISNTQNDNDKRLKTRQIKGNLLLSFYTADINDGKAILELFKDEKPDTCVHLAAKISVADSINNPEETMKTNVDGTLNVLEACYKNDVKNLLFASSAAVYGDVKSLPIKEITSLNPMSPYGESKMAAEKHILSYNKEKKIQNCIILRIFNVYGKGQQNETDVISRFAARLAKNIPPLIYGDGSQTRDFIALDDVVDAMILSLKTMKTKLNNNEKLAPSILNVGTGIPTSIKQIANKMIKMAGLELEPNFVEGTNDKTGILHSYADTAQARNVIGFVSKKQIDEGLKEIINLQGKPN